MFDGLYLLLGVFFLAGAFLFALYLAQSYALYRMAKRAGLPYSGIAWIPFCQNYLLGRLCDRARAFRGLSDWHFRVILPILSVIAPSAVPLLLWEISPIPSSVTFFSSPEMFRFYPFFQLLQMAATVGSAFALYYLYADYAPGREGGYAVLSALLASFAPPILLFLLRERIPLSAGGNPPRTPRWGTGTTGPWQYRQPPPPPAAPGGEWYRPQQPYQPPYRTGPQAGVPEDIGSEEYQIPPKPPESPPRRSDDPKGRNTKK